MSVTTRVAVGGTVAMLAWLPLLGCSQDRGDGPETQQVARMNRELATLQQSVATLQARLDRLESGHGSAAAKPAAPGAAAVPAEIGNATGIRPTADASLDVDASTVMVTLTQDGAATAYAIDGQAVAHEQFADALRKRADGKSAPRLLVQAGPNVPYKRVVAIIDLSKQIGIANFALSVDGRDEAKP